MAFIETLLLVSTISNSNIFVNAQQQQPPPKVEAPEQGTIFVFNEKSSGSGNEPEMCIIGQ